MNLGTVAHVDTADAYHSCSFLFLEHSASNSLRLSKKCCPNKDRATKPACGGCRNL